MEQGMCIFVHSMVENALVEVSDSGAGDACFLLQSACRRLLALMQASLSKCYRALTNGNAAILAQWQAEHHLRPNRRESRFQMVGEGVFDHLTASAGSAARTWPAEHWSAPKHWPLSLGTMQLPVH
jgi:hypothetical protein